MAIVENQLRSFAALFERRCYIESPGRWELWALAVLVAAGAFVRLWGLGSWGLEGDEKTMALPTLHVMRFGTPLMPSGMFYARGIGQLYLMAGSALLFGQSEWAFRIPSVICGILLIPIAYLCGRRFLRPLWNIGFVASVTFLPEMIASSQEARMYIFFMTSLAAYTALVFEWERSHRTVHLIAAVLAILVALQFHVLAVFGAFLLLFPGLLAADRRRLVHGAIAFGVVLAGFFALSHWINSFYPPRPIYGTERTTEHVGALAKIGAVPPLPIVLGLACAALLARWVARAITARGPAVAAGILLFLGMVCELALFFHVGVLLVLTGSLLAQRNGTRVWRRVAWVWIASVALAAFQLLYLEQVAGESARKTIGMMTGLPSVWPYVRGIVYSPAAWLVAGLGLLPALWSVARRLPIADYWLFFALSVWLPLFALGFFGWNVEARYTEFALVPVLLTAFAVCQQVVVMRARAACADTRSAQLACALTAAVLGVAVVNPLALARTVNAGYALHPDHKGAAEYIRAVHPSAADIIVAEDSLEQFYYLGHIDYWLRAIDDAAQFVEMKNGVLRDIYTGVPFIGTGPELAALVERRDRGAIYVIGTGEFKGAGVDYIHGHGIDAVLSEPTFRQVFVGRDGQTRVWKASAPAQDPAAAPGSS